MDYGTGREVREKDRQLTVMSPTHQGLLAAQWQITRISRKSAGHPPQKVGNFSLGRFHAPQPGQLVLGQPAKKCTSDQTFARSVLPRVTDDRGQEMRKAVRRRPQIRPA
jgi:hypothetical protein